MKKMILTLFVLCLTTLAGADDGYLIVPGRSVGKIGASTTRADLVRMFGAANVKEARIPLGEGETAPGTVVFPGDKKRRIEILWNSKKLINTVSITGKSSLWHTADGISLGTRLSKLEELNGKPFSFSGLGWDYGGNILSWEQGRLEKKLKGMWPTLGSDDDNPTPPSDFQAILGDIKVRSNNPSARRVKISVSQIRVVLNAD